MEKLLLFSVGLLVPLLGTTLGAAAVFFLKKDLSPRLTPILFGAAAGVMLSAAFFSLLSPAADLAAARGMPAFLPCVTGTLAGAFLFWGLDLYLDRPRKEGDRSPEKRGSFLWAVTAHNLPEGMAVGVILAGALRGEGVTAAAAMALAVGIAVQNFPEGAIVSLPLAGKGMKRMDSFFLGVLSGAVEPIGAVAACLFTALAEPVLPFVLSFAAGAMIYVASSELIPELGEGRSRAAGNAALAVGFALMTALDLALN